MRRKVIGWLLILVFSFNLFFSLFLQFETAIPQDTMFDRLPAIVFSILMLYLGYRLVRKQKAKVVK